MLRAIIAGAAATCASAALGQTTDGAVPSQAALESALAEATRAACPSARYAIDASLSLAAAAFARAVEEGRAAPSNAALLFYASLESAEPRPTAGVATAEPASLADRAVPDLLPRACHFDRAGVAAGRYGKGAVVAVLSAQGRGTFSDLPRRAEPGQRVQLEGRLAAGLKSPRLYVLKPGGTVETRELGAGPAFSARIAFAARGEHSVELLADGEGGPQVVALKRVFVGIDPPSSPPPEVSAPAGEQGAAAVALAIAALRRDHGLPALAHDAALDAVAEGHSAAMARARTFAHVLPGVDGALADRLAKAGYGHRFAGENIGLAESAARAHEVIALSPAHFANLLDPRFRRLGLGAVQGLSPEGTQAVYLTEVLAAPIVGLADPAGAVFKLAERERRRLGLEPLERDGRLDKVAEHEIRAAAISGAVRADQGVARRVLAAAPGLSGASVDLSIGSTPEDAMGGKNLRSPDWTRIGVGALYASSPTLGPGRLWVMLVLAR